MLSNSPMLNTARLQKKQGKTTYGQDFRKLLMELGTTPIIT
jgi:hypothetical protein